MQISLRSAFSEPVLDVMNFLNEAVLRYPDAISLAPGRPHESLFEPESSIEEIARYVAYRSERTGRPESEIWGTLGQYAPAAGVIRDLIARQLEQDEGIHAYPEAVLVTCGCQEAMALLLLSLFDSRRDVLLLTDPTYNGMSGLATIVGIETASVPGGEDGLDPDELAAVIEAVHRAGKRPRALYDIPDFNNPLGSRLPVSARLEVLAVAREAEILIFEDNPYGMFSYEGEPLPTLKALDRDRTVIYLGTFSKTLFPGLRLGYLVADQEVSRPSGSACSLTEELSKVKSLMTVSTSPLIQAIAGGILLRHGCSLRREVERKIPFYRSNRDRMLAALEAEFGAPGSDTASVRWNRPSGGFFLSVKLPIPFDREALEVCARDYGVICCPMSFFSLDPGREREIRLSFSYVSHEEIDEGIARLGCFVRQRLRRSGSGSRPATKRPSC